MLSFLSLIQGHNNISSEGRGAAVAPKCRLSVLPATNWALPCDCFKFKSKTILYFTAICIFSGGQNPNGNFFPLLTPWPMFPSGLGIGGGSNIHRYRYCDVIQQWLWNCVYSDTPRFLGNWSDFSLRKESQYDIVVGGGGSHQNMGDVFEYPLSLGAQRSDLRPVTNHLIGLLGRCPDLLRDKEWSKTLLQLWISCA